MKNDSKKNFTVRHRTVLFVLLFYFFIFFCNFVLLCFVLFISSVQLFIIKLYWLFIYSTIQSSFHSYDHQSVHLSVCLSPYMFLLSFSFSLLSSSFFLLFLIVTSQIISTNTWNHTNIKQKYQKSNRNDRYTVRTS